MVEINRSTGSHLPFATMSIPVTYPWKVSPEKKMSELRSIATLKAFDSTNMLTFTMRPIDLLILSGPMTSAG